MRTLDLFAGAGGASLGLISAGWEVIAAVEWDKDAAETYRRNIGDHVIEADITTRSPDDLPDADYIHFSAPCQGHSFAGKRDLNDPRNDLWLAACHIIAAKRPAFISSENVMGQATTGYDLRIMQGFEAIGYRMSRYKLNAADYGVPQTRKRVILIGNRLGLPNPCPTPTHAKPPGHLMLGLEPWVTVRQALGIGGTMTHKFSPTPKSAGTPFYDGDAMPALAQASTAQYFVDFSERLDAAAGILDQPSPVISAGGTATGGAEPIANRGLRDRLGEALLDEPSRALRAGAHGQPGFSPRHVGGYVPDDIAGLDDPAPTIPAQFAVDVIDGEGERRTYNDAQGRLHTRPAHSARLRRLTVAECSILQDFPPGYEFAGSQTSQYRQVGNAVPRGLGRAFAAAVRHALENA